MLNEVPLTESFAAPMPMGNKISGAIRKLKREKGYGFIAGDDGADYFFHWSAMNKDSKNYRDLVIQDRVEFSVKVTKDKGNRAVDICVV